MRRRAMRAAALVIPLFTAGIIALLWTPDLPREALVAKYGGPSGRFMDLPSGARAHYRDEGSHGGPILVLLHGSNSSLHTWEPWVRLLSDSLHCVSFDLPGHGLTGRIPGDDYSPEGMVRFVDEVRRLLGLERFSLAGNSMGGDVAFRYTLAHPTVVEKLVLVDSSGVYHVLPPGAQRVVPIGLRLIRSPIAGPIAARITPRSFVEKSVRAIFVDQSKVTSEMVTRYHELLLYPGNRHATRLRAQVPEDTRAAERLGEINAPTLILSGAEDPLVPIEAARIFHARIRGSRLIEYAGAGHIPMEEIPERTAADVKVFLLRP